MRKIALLFLMISNIAFSQKKDLVGNWISDKNEMIAISENIEGEKQTITNSNLTNQQFYLKVLEDTLSFQNKYYSSSDDYKTLHVIEYNLKILELTDSILIVKPVSRASRKFFETTNPIKFINQSFLKNDNFNFEKLIFKTSSCYGSCPVIQLRINANREIEMNAEYYNGMDMQVNEEKSGSYFGKLNDKLYSELIDLLIKSKIETLNIPKKDLCCDGAIKTIEVYHNGERNYVRTMFAPRMLKELIVFLYNLREKADLSKTNQKFKF